MELHAGSAGCPPHPHYQESAARNEQFVGECLKKIRAAPDAEEGLRRLDVPIAGLVSSEM